MQWRPKEKEQIIIYKAIHRRLKMAPHESLYRTVINLAAPEGFVDHVPHVTHVELMVRFRLRVIGVYAYINYIKLWLSCLDHLVYLIGKSIKLFGLMKVIPERCRVHYIRYLRVYCYNISLKSIYLTLIVLCPDKTVWFHNSIMFSNNCICCALKKTTK